MGTVQVQTKQHFFLCRLPKVKYLRVCSSKSMDWKTNKRYCRNCSSSYFFEYFFWPTTKRFRYLLLCVVRVCVCLFVCILLWWSVLYLRLISLKHKRQNKLDGDVARWNFIVSLFAAAIASPFTFAYAIDGSSGG